MQATHRQHVQATWGEHTLRGMGVGEFLADNEVPRGQAELQLKADFMFVFYNALAGIYNMSQDEQGDHDDDDDDMGACKPQVNLLSWKQRDP
eukprot:scaffold230942_cov19-Tisochrysis_lutea.AAC.1